ncbi:Class F sortase OS=Streptomyces violarus OX=67380 GN=FHS41_003418 PE=4 SV=1 [Streptomyces violarus]
MRRYGNTAMAAVTALALCAGAWLLRDGTTSHAPPQPSAAEAHADPAAGRPAAPALPLSPPDRIRIPAIRVDAPLTGLGLTRTNSWRCRWPGGPTSRAGTRRAPRPVSAAPRSSPGTSTTPRGLLFYGLGALRRGGTIEVDRRDGSVAVFTVDAVEVYQARTSPTRRSTARPPAELRVITCGGGDPRATGYQGNVVVFAHLTGSR